MGEKGGEGWVMWDEDCDAKVNEVLAEVMWTSDKAEPAAGG